MVKKKIYYLYFKGNDYQLLSGNHSEEIKNIMNGSSGTQILTIGLTKENENATEFVVWGSSKEEVKELLETGIKNVLDNLINYMEGDLKKGLELTCLEMLKNSSPNLGELFV